MFPEGFEWDINKNKANIQKHGINFEGAVGIFIGATTKRTVLHSTGELRVVAVGVMVDVFVTVIYTMRMDRKRIISARRSRQKEVFDYEQRHKNDR